MGDTENSMSQKKIYPPDELQKWLNENTAFNLFLRLRARVFGQDESLKDAAVLIYGYIKTMRSGRVDPKFHFLIEGRTGCGKTTFANALSEVLPCPVITVDASQLTPAGFKGAEAGDFVSSEELREWYGCGVVILDELDKVMEPLSSSSSDNFHRQGLENLLKMLDGGTVYDRDGRPIDCSRVLFVGMGAFAQIEQENQVVKRQIGFVANEAAMKKAKLTKGAMAGYCGSEQFLGRFVKVFHFKVLGEELYRRIILQTQLELSRTYGAFRLSEEEVERIMDESAASEFGCRGIQSAVWDAFLRKNMVITNEDLKRLKRHESGSCA